MLTGIIVGVILVVMLTAPAILPASTRYMGPTGVGLVIKRVGKRLHLVLAS